MLEFDLQRFDDDEAEQSSEEAQPLPEELNGLPEDIARETFAEREASQTETDAESKPGAVPYERFKEKIDEANRLKAQLEEYQQRFQQPPQPTITPEFSKQLQATIEAEALALTGLTKEALKEIEYADDDDPRVAQWQQAKVFATYKVLNG